MEENTTIPANDVNTTTDTQTVGDSSSDTQQTPVVPSQDNATENTTDTSTQTTGNKAVPYERFQEVNEAFKQTQAEIRAMREQQSLIAQQQQGLIQAQMPAQDPTVAAAKQQLKGLIQELAPELGFVSKADIEKQNAISEVENMHNSLADKYNGKDGLPKYDKQAVLDYAINMGMTNAKGLEIAYKQMHEAEIMNARLQQMLQQSRGVQTETSNGTGSVVSTGVQDSDLKKAAQAGDPDAVHLLLKRRLSGK